MNFRITDLRNFVEIARCRTMREGAELLQISQPALSESIKRLEQDLGEVLFYRARSGISLTPAGVEVERKGRLAVHALQDVEEREEGANRLVTLGCHPTVGSYFLPQLFSSYAGGSPFQFRLRHGLSREVQLDIQQGRVDVGVVVNPIPSPDLVIRVIGTDEVSVWQTPGFLDLNPQLFCDVSLNQTHSILKRWKKSPSRIVESDDLELMARIVARGAGMGILPERLIRLLGLKLKKVEGAPQFRDQFALVHRPEFGRNAQERNLLEHLKASFAK